MSVEDALVSLVELPDRAEGFALALGVKHGDEYDFRNAVLSDAAAEQLFSDASTWIRSLKELAPELYQVGTLRQPTEIDYIEVSGVVGGEQLIDQVTPIADLPRFDGDERFLNDVSQTVAALIDKNQNQATLFRRATNAFLLQRTRSKLRFVYSNGVLDEARDEIVQVDRRYDCICWNGYIFITDVHAFEKLFDYERLRYAHARTTLDDVAAAIPFADREIFINTFLRDSRYYRKIESVVRRRIFDRVSVEKIEKFVYERGLQITFSTDRDGRRVLDFDPSVAGRKALMALLDDDHLSSPLTNQDYEANSKREWSRSR